jgi:hypothetical protein
MHRAPTPVRALAVVLATALFVLSGGATLAVADDYLHRDILPAGAEAGGIDLSDLDRDAARRVIERDVAGPLAMPVEVAYGARTFTLETERFISVDVDAMLETAFQPRRSTPLPYRVSDRALGRPWGASAEVDLAVDEGALALWLDTVASVIDTPPVDATMTVAVDRLELQPAADGARLDRDATLVALREALLTGEKRVELDVERVAPAVTAEDLGPAILVDISRRRLFLYDRGQLVKDYGVAVGTPGHPTPTGDFHITLKRYMPSWGNPGSAWAADMPAYIPPGPSNPLGTRALNLDAPGIRIHGTTANYSIGTAASHGCMRMHRWDIEDLYERVEVGTPVYIVR